MAALDTENMANGTFWNGINLGYLLLGSVGGYWGFTAGRPHGLAIGIGSAILGIVLGYLSTFLTFCLLAILIAGPRDFVRNLRPQRPPANQQVESSNVNEGL